MGEQIGQQGGMLQSIGPEVLGGLAVEQERAQNLPNSLIPGLSDAVLLRTIGIGKIDLDPFGGHLVQQVLVDKF